MPAASRITIPAEFYDKTDDMLLTQPEPQYLYAQLWLRALGTDLPATGPMGLPGRTVSETGAPYANLDSDRLKLATDLPGSLIAAKVDFAGAPGNTIRINRPAYTDSTYTDASRMIASGTSISTTPLAPKSEQTNLTLFRYGGPYGASAVQPLGIEAFDASLGVHKLTQIVGNTLVRDFHKFIDARVVALADLGANTVWPDGMSAANDATATDQFPFRFEQILRAHEKANTLKLPTLPDGHRVMVLTPVQLRQLASDQRYQNASRNFPELSVLFPSYVKSVHKCHIFESSTLTTAANSSSIDVHTGHLLAPGALMAGMGRRPRVAPATDDNYGETAKVIWLADLAFGVADNRFSVLVKSAA